MVFCTFSSYSLTCKNINHGAFDRELNSLQDDIVKFLGENHQTVFSKKSFVWASR